MPAAQWRGAQAAHEARVDAAAAGHLARRGQGRAHPVEDFLWVYYRFRPGQLRRWHPGPGVWLQEDPDSPAPQRQWRHYRVRRGAGPAPAHDCVGLDVPAFLAHRGEAVRDVLALLEATAARAPRHGCFGLHEWAMVYRSDETRHPWPLRLGAQGTDDVVRSHPLRCTHYDAFRFFTGEAAPLNEMTPTLALRPALEQPGCLHAGMDLYKWAYTLTPAIPSDLVMDCFAHARAAREIDMRAAPYDLRELGYEPIPIETAQGRARYVQEQQRSARAAAPLRARLIDACRRLLDPAVGGAGPAQRSPCGP